MGSTAGLLLALYPLDGGISSPGSVNITAVYADGVGDGLSATDRSTDLTPHPTDGLGGLQPASFSAEATVTIAPTPMDGVSDEWGIVTTAEINVWPDPADGTGDGEASAIGAGAVIPASVTVDASADGAGDERTPNIAIGKTIVVRRADGIGDFATPVEISTQGPSVSIVLVASADGIGGQADITVAGLFGQVWYCDLTGEPEEGYRWSYTPGRRRDPAWRLARFFRGPLRGEDSLYILDDGTVVTQLGSHSWTEVVKFCGGGRKTLVTDSERAILVTAGYSDKLVQE